MGSKWFLGNFNLESIANKTQFTELATSNSFIATRKTIVCSD